MLRAFSAFVTGSLVAVLAACTGGPGPLPDGSSEGNTGGTDTTSGSATGDTATSPPSNTTSSTSSSSGSSSGGSCSVSAAGLDTSCSTDSDCTLVFVGPISSCACSNFAINKNDLTKYQTQATQGAQGCNGQTGSSGGQCSCPTNIRPSCNTSTKRCAVTSSAGSSSSGSSGADAGF